MKYTVANNELNLGGKNGLYCFLPYERSDDKKTAIFKCGMTTQDFADSKTITATIPWGCICVSSSVLRG